MPCRQVRHVERLIAVGTVLSAVGQQPIEPKAQALRVWTEILFHQPRLEPVETRRYGSVGGKNIACGRGLPRFVIRQTKLFPECVRALQTQECRVPLVHVAYRWPDAERLQGPHPAD